LTTTATEIEKAVLTLTIEGGTQVPEFGASTLCTAYLYRMDVAWSESTASWDHADFGGNGINFGIEVPSEPGFTAPIPPCEPLGVCFDGAPDHGLLAADDWRGTRSFDVTEDVRDFLTGAEDNNGWAILMRGDGHEPLELLCDFEEQATWFRSSQWSVATERPTLTVVVSQ